MRQKITVTAGTLMIAGGLLGASLTFNPMEGVSAQETDRPAEERNETHNQMHTMMDGMMGEGVTERMHAQMPGSEEMMEACTSGMDGMMNGMDGMMDGDTMDQTSPEDEREQEGQ